MSNTGTYKMVKGKFIKVSDRLPKLRSSVYYPPRSKRSCGSYYDEHLGDTWVHSKDHKRKILQEQHLKEAG